MIILPTIDRPLNLRRFISAYEKTRGVLPIHVVLDAANAYLYDNIKLPSNWKRCTVPPGTRLGDIFNLIYKAFPNEDYYGMVADDIVPESFNWDTKLAAACQPNKIAWGWDGIQNENLPVHPFIGGDLVRALGWWAAPGIKHWFVDNVWKNLAVVLHNGRYFADIRMTHYHYVNGLAEMDLTYKNQPSHSNDEASYVQFMRTEFPKIVQRLGGKLDEASSERRSLSS